MFYNVQDSSQRSQAHAVTEAHHYTASVRAKGASQMRTLGLKMNEN